MCNKILCLLAFMLFMCVVFSGCDAPERVDEAVHEREAVIECLAETAAHFVYEQASGAYGPNDTEQPAAQADYRPVDITRLKLNEMVLQNETLYGGVAESISTHILTVYFPGIPIIGELMSSSLESATVRMLPPEGRMQEGVVLEIELTAANIRSLWLTYKDSAGETKFIADISPAGMNGGGGVGFHRRQLSNEPYRYALCYKENDFVFMLTERRGEYDYSFRTSIMMNLEDARAFFEQAEVQAFIDTMDAWMTQE